MITRSSTSTLAPASTSSACTSSSGSRSKTFSCRRRRRHIHVKAVMTMSTTLTVAMPSTIQVAGSRPPELAASPESLTKGPRSACEGPAVVVVLFASDFRLMMRRVASSNTRKSCNSERKPCSNDSPSNRMASPEAQKLKVRSRCRRDPLLSWARSPPSDAIPTSATLMSSTLRPKPEATPHGSTTAASAEEAWPARRSCGRSSGEPYKATFQSTSNTGSQTAGAGAPWQVRLTRNAPASPHSQSL
mmetsp:Transcript_96096/g.213999  ORF Transcript_96096/g.213999 Transcript_96096/m.213999 type:complete len:246 (+) Transcript_96096:1072-1809(+)